MTEQEIRKTLIDRLKNQNKCPRTRVEEELCLRQGAARIDVAVVNGIFHGYEIKSRKDTLARLPAQIEVYNQVFDYVTLVVDAAHLDKAINLIPEWWGIYVPRRRGSQINFSVVRNRERNRNGLRTNALAEFLWKDEALEVLKERGLDRGIRSKPKHVLWDRLSKELSVSDLGAVVRETLKSRTDWRVAV